MVSAFAVSGLLLLGFGFATGAGGEVLQGDDASHITVVQTPSYSNLGCLPAALALSHETSIMPGAFKVTIRASAPLCTPTTVSAVIYEMPGGGQAWPQQLAEKVDFTLGQPGKTEVTFARTCQPAQYDIVNGVTPATISPTGATHGPLLFAPSTSTSMQDFAYNCGSIPSTTTSVVVTTTTQPDVVGSSTTVLGSTTTEPAGVLGTSTTLPDGNSPATTAAVKGISATPNTPGLASVSSGTGVQGLAVTGVNSSTIALWAGMLLLVGSVVLGAVRMRVFR